MSKNLLEKNQKLMKRRFQFALLVVAMVSSNSSAHAWDFGVPDEETAIVRTYFNPAFGSFDYFTLPKADQRSWDIQNYGVFFLNIYCHKQQYLTVTKFQKWSDEKSVWENIDFPKSASLKLIFGTGKPINWGTKVSEDIEGTIISNPKLFINKLLKVKSLSYPVSIDGRSYKVKFNVAGLGKFMPDLKGAGCQ